MSETWQPASFLVAMMAQDEPTLIAGYTYRGLGLSLNYKTKARRPKKDGTRTMREFWTLTHVGSGHRVCGFEGNVAAVFPLAWEVANLGDWDFDGLYGWKNRDPELMQKFREWAAKNGIKRGNNKSSEDMARAVAMAL